MGSSFWLSRLKQGLLWNQKVTAYIMEGFIMTMNKVKEFCKEHKADIAIGAVSAIAGGFLAEYLCTHPRGSEKTLLRNLKSFGNCLIDGRPMVEKVLDASAGADRVRTLADITEVNVTNIGEKLMDVYQENGFDMESPITGVVVFHTHNK